MKKLLMPLAVVLLLCLAIPGAFAEAELGLGFTPGSVGGGGPDSQIIPSFHVGYSWNILYISWDAYAMPDYWTYTMTTYVDPNTGWTYPGYPVPSFLNMFDAGIKIVLKPFIGYAEVGPNFLYLRGGQTYGKVGVNIRLGAGVKFGWWGINLSGTQVFASWDDMGAAFRWAGKGDWSYITQGMAPTLNFTLYF
jgi:hypothetical protein